MELSNREKNIIKIVKKYEPITGDRIACELSLSKSTIRTELSILVKLGILESKTNVGYFFNNDFVKKAEYDTLKLIKVSEVMALACTAKATETLSEIITKIFLHDIGTIFIVDDDNNLFGVVSRKDMLKILVSNSTAHTMPVAMAMTRVPNVVYLSEEETILDALRKIINHEVDCLPVIREDNGKKIIGRISKTTIIRLLLDVLEG